MRERAIVSEAEVNAATVRPVVGETTRAGEVRPGEWVQWDGRFWWMLGEGWLVGPVGEAQVWVAPDTVVRRVEV